jgi:hypothetical protein
VARNLNVFFDNDQVTFFIPDDWAKEHPTDTPKWRSPFRELEEPLLTRASAGLLALGDVFLEKLNAEMNKATDQLRLEAQEEVLEVGEVDEVESGLGRVCKQVGECAGVRRYGKSLKEIPHINNELLELSDVQSPHVKVGFAREELFVVKGKRCQCPGVEAGSVLDVLQ